MATDIANIHYPGWPFEKVGGEDPRPMYFGEYFFPVCHEQTDVQIDPGLRELWGQGCAEPDSDFSRACAADFDRPPAEARDKAGRLDRDREFQPLDWRLDLGFPR